jgi:hypothetical protein
MPWRELWTGLRSGSQKFRFELWFRTELQHHFKGESENESLEEGGEALGVKNDIERWSRTLKVPLRWVSLPDHYGITRRGTRPRLNPPVFVKRSFADIMASSERNNRSRTIG